MCFDCMSDEMFNDISNFVTVEEFVSGLFGSMLFGFFYFGSVFRIQSLLLITQYNRICPLNIMTNVSNAEKNIESIM